MPRQITSEEGRGKLRKATGSRKLALICRCPNGETRMIESYTKERTRGIETSQYPEEEKVTTISQVAASERERA